MFFDEISIKLTTCLSLKDSLEAKCCKFSSFKWVSQDFDKKCFQRSEVKTNTP